MTYNNSNNIWNLEINNYTSTTNYKSFSINGMFYDFDYSALKGTLTSGGIATSSAISSLEFTTTFTGGNFSTGTVLLYGVK